MVEERGGCFYGFGGESVLPAGSDKNVDEGEMMLKIITGLSLLSFGVSWATLSCFVAADIRPSSVRDVLLIVVLAFLSVVLFLGCLELL